MFAQEWYDSDYVLGQLTVLLAKGQEQASKLEAPKIPRKALEYLRMQHTAKVAFPVGEGGGQITQ